MTTTELLLVAAALLADSVDHFYRTARLIAALLIATLVPFLIDRYARRSSRVNR